MFVNNVDLRQATHSEAAKTLISSGETVFLIVDQNSLEKYHEFERNFEIMANENRKQYENGEIEMDNQSEANEINLVPPPEVKPKNVKSSTTKSRNLSAEVAQQKSQQQKISENSQTSNPTKTINENETNYKLENKIIKVLFDFNPEIDSQIPARGMNLKFGDILSIVDSQNDEWWRVKRLNEPQDEKLVPSIKRLEAKCSSKYRSVYFIKSSNSNSSGRLTFAPDASQSPVLLPGNGQSNGILTYGLGFFADFFFQMISKLESSFIRHKKKPPPPENHLRLRNHPPQTPRIIHSPPHNHRRTLPPRTIRQPSPIHA